MANLTLAVDDEKLARLRVYAAEKRTTVNALVRTHVDDLLDGDERRRTARAKLLEMVDRNIAHDAERAAKRAQGEPVEDEGWRWNREDCYTGPRFDRMQRG